MPSLGVRSPCLMSIRLICDFRKLTYFPLLFQAKALANAVFAYASNIDDLGKLTDAIGIIAQKHVSFQVPPNSYQDVGTELLKSIKEILGIVRPVVKKFSEGVQN